MRTPKIFFLFVPQAAGLFCLAILLLIAASVSGQESQKPTGTGFVVDPTGYLLTCQHVVKDAEKVEVSLGEKTYEAAVLSSDEKRDLALLQINAKGLTALPLGNSNKVEVGEEVWAFGFPLSSVLGDSVKVTRGIISGVETEEALKVFQIDAAVNPGNSGGPLVNNKGEVIGITNAKLVGIVISDVGFAVPINYTKQILRDEGVGFASENVKAKIEATALIRQVSPAIALITITPKGTGIGASSTPVRRNPKDNAEMVYIPAGEFVMGSDKGKDSQVFDNEMPQHKVYLDGYWIYKYEVTVAQYSKFCQDTKRQIPSLPNRWPDSHPIVNVTYDDAIAYCQWSGVKLPTEAQWEKAARGTDGRIYPWGDRFVSSKCNFNSSGTTPVGSYPEGVSPYGVMDMAGNVMEWCADWYDSGYYEKSPERNPTGPDSGSSRVLRGGSWSYGGPATHLRLASRFHLAPANTDSDAGFRCAGL